jgi:thioredoxin 1
MTPLRRTLILAAVAVGAVAALALRPAVSADPVPLEVAPAAVAAAGQVSATAANTAQPLAGPATATAQQGSLPQLLELGSTSCRSCKAMHEELAQLRKSCASSIRVHEVDVWKDDTLAKKYHVRVIPTQVFLDATGQEVDRHVGFLAQADIVARFAQRGVGCTP